MLRFTGMCPPGLSGEEQLQREWWVTANQSTVHQQACSPSRAWTVSAATVGFMGEVARQGGMCAGRPMFELGLYDSSTEWPWAMPTQQGCKIEQGDVYICIHTCMYISALPGS